MNYQTRNPGHLRDHRRSLLPMEADNARCDAAAPYIITALVLFALLALGLMAEGVHF